MNSLRCTAGLWSVLSFGMLLAQPVAPPPTDPSLEPPGKPQLPVRIPQQPGAPVPVPQPPSPGDPSLSQVPVAAAPFQVQAIGAVQAAGAEGGDVDPATGLSLPAELRFDLDFAGGHPADLVEAMQEAGVGTLNVIIPEELAETELPALRVKGVTVAQLFEALGLASRRTVMVTNAGYAGLPGGMSVSLSRHETSFGFRTQGQLSPNSIWYFYAEEPPAPPTPPPARVVRFYQLAPYLDGYEVDDITGAIQTGWRMLGAVEPPVLKFDPATKLLIAVGDPTWLQIIEEVLGQLGNGSAGPSARPPAPPPRPRP